MSRFGRGKVLRAQVEFDTYRFVLLRSPRGAQELNFPVPNVPYLKIAAVAGEGRQSFAVSCSIAT